MAKKQTALPTTDSPHAVQENDLSFLNMDEMTIENYYETLKFSNIIVINDRIIKKEHQVSA